MGLKELILASSMFMNPQQEVYVTERPTVEFPSYSSNVKLNVNDGVFAYLQHMDAMTTFKAIDSGKGYESNSLMTYLFGKNMERRKAARVLKYGLAGAGLSLSLARNIPNADIPQGLMIPVNLLYGLIVFNNAKIAEMNVPMTPLATVNF